MSLPREVQALALARRDTQQRLAAGTVAVGRQRWGRLDPVNLRGSWVALVAPMLMSLVTAAQQQAAAGAQPYVTDVLAAQGAGSDLAGSVAVSAFVGVASDGRALQGLLSGPLYETLRLIGQGLGIDQALTRGRSMLDRVLATQVQDAARVSVGVGQVANRSVKCWTRQTVPPSCSRCIILAGRVSHVQTAFDRHPFCDCVNVPSAEIIEPESPRRLFDRMSDRQLREAGWTDADVAAIRDGGDIYQVTNAHRELRTVTFAGQQVQTTTVGTTRYGLAGRRLGSVRGQTPARLTPEAIYQLAGSRDEAIEMLRRYGYIL
jgi:hypothetical protein